MKTSLKNPINAGIFSLILWAKLNFLQVIYKGQVTTLLKQQSKQTVD